MLSYLLHDKGGEIEGADFSSKMLGLEYQNKLSQLIEKEKENDSSIRLERNTTDTKTTSQSQSRLQQMGDTSVGTRGDGVLPTHRQDNGSSQEREILHQADTSRTIRETPSNYVGDDTLPLQSRSDTPLADGRLRTDGTQSLPQTQDGIDALRPGYTSRDSSEGILLPSEQGEYRDPQGGDKTVLRQDSGERNLHDMPGSHSDSASLRGGTRTQVENGTQRRGELKPLSPKEISEHLPQTLKDAYNKYPITQTEQFQKETSIVRDEDYGVRMTLEQADEILNGKTPLFLKQHDNWAVGIKKEIRKEGEDGFGIEFFSNKDKPLQGLEAITTLLKYKVGEVKAAFHKEGLGDIDLVWGEVSDPVKHTGYGLAHIVDKHPEIVERIPEIIEKGKFIKDEKNRFRIELNNEIVGIKDNWRGEKSNHWIVTSYEKEGDKSLYTSLSPLKQGEILPHSSLANSTTTELKNQPLKEFGTNYPEYYHDGKGAIEKLLQTKEGQVQGAFHRPDIGDIDLMWGNEKMGLAHILEKHPEVIEKIPEVIEKGIYNENRGAGKIEYNNSRIGLSKGYMGKGENHWILTAYDLIGGSKPSSFSSGSAIVSRESLPKNPYNEDYNFIGNYNQEKPTNPYIQKAIEIIGDKKALSPAEIKIKSVALSKSLPLFSTDAKDKILQLDAQKFLYEHAKNSNEYASKIQDIQKEIKSLTDDLKISQTIQKDAVAVVNEEAPTNDLLPLQEGSFKEDGITQEETKPYHTQEETQRRKILQDKAEIKTDFKYNDLEDIKKDLPYLLPEQIEDVKFAEERFLKGRGVLFTNGTGTGKTLTGLGIIKRKIKAGGRRRIGWSFSYE